MSTTPRAINPDDRRCADRMYPPCRTTCRGCEPTTPTTDLVDGWDAYDIGWTAADLGSPPDHPDHVQYMAGYRDHAAGTYRSEPVPHLRHRAGGIPVSADPGPPPAQGPGTNTGHGHVWPRPDGKRARCGGPRVCKECAVQAAQAAPSPSPAPSSDEVASPENVNEWRAAVATIGAREASTMTISPRDLSAFLDALIDARAALAARDAEVRPLREDNKRLADALTDCVVKATEYGEQDGGFVAFYLLPTGPIHRAIPLLDGRGIYARPGFDPRVADAGSPS